MPVLIPFALDAVTGEVREIGDVNRGRACDCVCISCGSELEARQGEKRVWHFAHDDRGIDGPKKECELSFESACRLFIIHLLKRGAIARVSVPPGSSINGAHSKSAGRWKVLDDLRFEESHEYGDVKAVRAGYALEVIMVYGERSIISEPKDMFHTAVLGFHVESVRKKFYASRGGSKVLSDIVSELFLAEGKHKVWLYYPSTMTRSADQAYPDKVSSGSSSDRPERSQGFAYCYSCDYEWVSGREAGRICPRCDKGTTTYSSRSRNS